MIRPVQAALAIVSLVASAASHGECVPVQGLVSSTPDATCQIQATIAPWFTSGAEAPDPFLFQLGVPSASACFQIKGSGIAQFTGFSGLTFVGVAGAFGGTTATPLGYAPGARSALTGFTSQAVLTGTLGAGRNRKAGTLFTKDTGTVTSTGVVGQVLLIVGGTEGFAGASGTIAVAGQEVGAAAVYTGSVCTP